MNTQDSTKILEVLDEVNYTLLESILHSFVSSLKRDDRVTMKLLVDLITTNFEQTDGKKLLQNQYISHVLSTFDMNGQYTETLLAPSDDVMTEKDSYNSHIKSLFLNVEEVFKEQFALTRDIFTEAVRREVLVELVRTILQDEQRGVRSLLLRCSKGLATSQKLEVTEPVPLFYEFLAKAKLTLSTLISFLSIEFQSHTVLLPTSSRQVSNDLHIVVTEGNNLINSFLTKYTEGELQQTRNDVDLLLSTHCPEFSHLTSIRIDSEQFLLNDMVSSSIPGVVSGLRAVIAKKKLHAPRILDVLVLDTTTSILQRYLESYEAVMTRAFILLNSENPQDGLAALSTKQSREVGHCSLRAREFVNAYFLFFVDAFFDHCVVHVLLLCLANLPSFKYCAEEKVHTSSAPKNFLSINRGKAAAKPDTARRQTIGFLGDPSGTEKNELSVLHLVMNREDPEHLPLLAVSSSSVKEIAKKWGSRTKHSEAKQAATDYFHPICLLFKTFFKVKEAVDSLMLVYRKEVQPIVAANVNFLTLNESTLRKKLAAIEQLYGYGVGYFVYVAQLELQGAMLHLLKEKALDHYAADGSPPVDRVRCADVLLQVLERYVLAIMKYVPTETVKEDLTMKLELLTRDVYMGLLRKLKVSISSSELVNEDIVVLRNFYAAQSQGEESTTVKNIWATLSNCIVLLSVPQNKVFDTIYDSPVLRNYKSRLLYDVVSVRADFTTKRFGSEKEWMKKVR